LTVRSLEGKSLVWDDDALAVARRTRASVSYDRMPTVSVLYRILKPHGLRFTFEGDVVRISLGVSGPPSEELELIESSTRVLLEGHDGHFAEHRKWLCGALARLGATSAVPALCRTLDDDDVETRIAAADALAVIRDRSAVMRALASASTRVQAGAVRALGRMGNRADVPAVLRKLYAPDEELRREVALALGRLGDTSVAPRLATVLRGDSAPMRLAAARGLVIMGGERVRDALISALDDENAAVRETAAIGLVKSGHKDATRILKDLIARRGLERRTRYRVDSAMRSDERLRQQFDSFSEEAAQEESRAAWALIAFRDVRAVDFFVAMLRDDDEAVFRTAVTALGAIGDASTLAILERVLVSKPDRSKRALEDAIRRIERRLRDKRKRDKADRPKSGRDDT
jgi:HEAT repeat protein